MGDILYPFCQEKKEKAVVGSGLAILHFEFHLFRCPTRLTARVTVERWGHPLKKDTCQEKKYSVSKKELNFFLKAEAIC